MPAPGKNAPGLRGFPTPNSVPDESGYTVFRFPNDNEWVGLLLGAAQLLTKAYNFYQWGELTPDEAAAAWQVIVDQAPYNGCPATLPGGGRIIRLNHLTGRLEELGDDGEWSEPSGDYAVPPVTPREGGTPQDQRCLAAANAAHVLEVLYESITDSISHDLEAAEAYTALVAAFVAAVGWEFAPIAFALAAFFLVVFEVVYEIVKVLAADVWDGTFTATLKCALYDCSDDTDGVVTFDWTCVRNKLAEGTDALNFDQLRLFNQLNFIIQVIGGADGLNLAGATTSIDTADCSDCEGSWCWTWDTDALNAGGDWTHDADESYSQIYTSAPAGAFSFTFAELEYAWNFVDGGGGSGAVIRCDGDNVAEQFPLFGGTGVITYDGATLIPDDLLIAGNTDSPSGGGTFVITRFTMRGAGATPGFIDGEAC